MQDPLASFIGFFSFGLPSCKIWNVIHQNSGERKVYSSRSQIVISKPKWFRQSGLKRICFSEKQFFLTFLSVTLLDQDDSIWNLFLFRNLHGRIFNRLECSLWKKPNSWILVRRGQTKPHKYLELLAVFYGLRCFALHLHECDILLRVDNSTAF